MYGEICQIETCTTKISESREYIDIIIVTLTSGEMMVYNYAKDEKRFVCSYREMIFKAKNNKMNL